MKPNSQKEEKIDNADGGTGSDMITIKKTVAENAGLSRVLMSCRYWAGISSCECDSEHPIGGCLKCDMEEAIKTIESLAKNGRVCHPKADPTDGRHK